MSLERLSVPKIDGGMQIRDTHGFNLALLEKQVWNLTSNPKAMVGRIFKARYYSRGEFLDAELGHKEYSLKELKMFLIKIRIKYFNLPNYFSVA